MMINYIHICKRIKEYRTAKKITQAELAEMIDRSVQYVSQIERSIKFPSLETVILIANALEITVDQLLNGNQFNYEFEYFTEINKILSECNSYERSVIYEVAMATKIALRENQWMNSKNRHY